MLSISNIIIYALKKKKKLRIKNRQCIGTHETTVALGSIVEPSSQQLVLSGGLMFAVVFQEERLVEKDCSSWKLHGEPTVLLTMAHIFNQFAPLMVRTRTALIGWFYSVKCAWYRDI